MSPEDQRFDSMGLPYLTFNDGRPFVAMSAPLERMTRPLLCHVHTRELGEFETRSNNRVPNATSSATGSRLRDDQNHILAFEIPKLWWVCFNAPKPLVRASDLLV